MKKLLILLFCLIVINGYSQNDTISYNQENRKCYMYGKVDENPVFPGGGKELLFFIAKHTKYPEIEQEEEIIGKVYVNFIINEKGEVENIKIEKSLHPLLDQEAIRVTKLLPDWKPGKHNGENVKVSYVLHFDFYYD